MAADLMITIVFCVEASFVLIVGSVVFVHEARKAHAEAARARSALIVRGGRR
jgi:hypothetical protein